MNRLLDALVWIGRYAPAALIMALVLVLDASAAQTLTERFQAYAVGLGMTVGGPVGLMVAFFLAGRMVPGLIVKKLSRVFEEAKTSPWWRDPAKPHRAKFLYAAAVFLEAEVPNPGEGQEVYDTFGVWANSHARMGGVPLGSAEQWSTLARKGGDAIDLELDARIVELALLVEPPVAPPPPADA